MLVWVVIPLVLIGIIGIEQSFADLADDGETETKKITMMVQKILNGKPVIEKQEVEGTFRIATPPTLKECTKTSGWIPLNPTSDSKIMPDLQTKIDEGRESLCVTILLPLHGELRWEDVREEYFEQKKDDIIKQITDSKYLSESSKEYFVLHPDKYFPEVYAKHEFISKERLERLDILTTFLEENGAVMEQNYLWHQKSISPMHMRLGANVPSELIPKLVERDDVIIIDEYSKVPKIPYHIQQERDSKISSYVQEQIDSGMKLIPIDILLPTSKRVPLSSEYCCFSSIPLSESEKILMQKPILELLELHKMETIFVNKNTIIANISPSIIFELEKFDDVQSLNYFYSVITSFDNDLTMEKYPQKNDINENPLLDVLMDDNYVRFSINGDIQDLKEIVIPDNVVGKETELFVNGILENNFEIIYSSDSKNVLVLPIMSKDVSIKNFPQISLLKQVKAGISIFEIQCNDRLELAKKKSNGDLVCIKSSSIEKLFSRDYISDLIRIGIPHALPDIERK